MLSQIFNKQNQTKKDTDNHIRADITTIFSPQQQHNHHQIKTLQIQISFHPTGTHFRKIHTTK